MLPAQLGFNVPPFAVAGAGYLSVAHWQICRHLDSSEAMAAAVEKGIAPLIIPDTEDEREEKQRQQQQQRQQEQSGGSGSDGAAKQEPSGRKRRRRRRKPNKWK